MLIERIWCVHTLQKEREGTGPRYSRDDPRDALSIRSSSASVSDGRRDSVFSRGIGATLLPLTSGARWLRGE